MQSFSICKRQAWLMAHQIIPDQDHPFIALGRVIDEESYEREKKKVNLEDMAIDFIRNEKEDIVVCEVKKSSKAKESAKIQLAFYLYKLKQKGLEAKGLLLFPEEKRKIALALTEELEKEVEELIFEIRELIAQDMPPKVKKIPYCKNCGYREFCWS